MKMRTFFYLIGLFLTMSIYAQKDLQGTIKDNDGVPLTGANIYIKGTYNGTVSDENGIFHLTTTSLSDSVVIISYIGYERKEIPVHNDMDSLNIILKEVSNNLNEVRITAGAFEAGEENRAVFLDPIDIATTASSDADVYGALSTFPGAQKQQESGKLIVRGGEADETKTYIDGMLVSSPYGTSMPDLPARGRFSPFMFNGVMFSTGGYSAEYGQALSSVLELQTPGIFDEDITSLSLMNVGIGGSFTRNFTRSAISCDLFYSNTYPYFAMASHDLNWIKIPQDINGKFFHRKKVGKTGMIKTDAILNYSTRKLDYSDMDIEYSTIRLVNDNQFIKSTYNTEIGRKWILKTGVAFNRDMDNNGLDNDRLKENLNTGHVKFSLTNFANDNITLKTGIDANYLDYRFQYDVDTATQDVNMDVKDLILAGYIESDLKLNRKFALRIGTRVEHSTFNTMQNIAPRASMAYKLSKTSQISLAWGQFFQQSSYDYLKYTDQLKFEKAQHFLVNYQFQKESRVFRTEIYYKTYNDLITYLPGTVEEYTDLGNNGNGYAQGIDIFWKDDQTFCNTSYWISYSYINSERKYKDYTEKAVPGFISPHNLSIVYKYWWNALSTQFAATYTYASGRSYYNPNNDDFMSDRTPAIQDLSANASYVTNIFNQYTIIHLSVSNLLGQDHVYSYRYSETPDESGNYEGTQVKNLIRRTIILGIFITIH